MFALSYKTKSSPYVITTKPIYPRFIPEEFVATSKSREGVVTLSTSQIYYSISDIKVDGEKIDFVEIPERTQPNSLQEINQYLVSKPFMVDDDTELFYTIRFGISDSTALKSALRSNDFIKFRVELVDASTGELLGVFEEVTYTQNEVSHYNDVTYQINTNRIGSREVRLRLVIGTNVDPYFAINDKYIEEETVLAK